MEALRNAVYRYKNYQFPSDVRLKWTDRRTYRSFIYIDQVMPRRKLTTPIPRLVLDKSGIWLVSYTHTKTGQTRKLSTGKRNRDDAELAMPAIAAKIVSPAALKNESYKLGGLLDAYLQYHEMIRLKDGKKDAIWYALQKLIPFFSEFRLSQLNDNAWQTYRDHRTSQFNCSAGMRNKKKCVSDSTACRELSALRGALSWGRRNGWGGLENVKVHIPNEPQSTTMEFLTRSEARRLIEACNEPHQKLFVRLALATGARTSALLELKWEDVLWPMNIVKPLWESDAVTATNSRDCPIHGVEFDLEMREPLRLNLGQGRGNKRRGTGIITNKDVWLYEELFEAYEKRQTDFVIEYRGKNVKKIDLSLAYKRAGLAYSRRQHILKHTCCSWLVQEGVSFEKIAKLIGTTAIVIEKHYGHLSPEHLNTIGDALAVKC